MNNATWGPALWRLLHIVAERVLSRPAAIEFTLLLHSLPPALPCPNCQDHAANHIKAHPYNPPASASASVPLQEYTRRWVWEFHEMVNIRRGISSGIHLNAVGAMYKVNSYSITNLLNTFEKEVIAWVNPAALATFKRHLLKLM